MNVREVNWFSFWDTYVLGARRYVLKEEDETLDTSRCSFRKAYYREIGLRMLLLLVAVGIGLRLCLLTR